MPFTFAHPAAVLPFKFLPRKWYSWTGLLIGSIVPDFEAFLKLGGPKYLSHSWPGVFLFNLPFGLTLVVLFHAVVRDPLVANLPGFLYSRFVPVTLEPWLRTFQKRLPIIISSLLIGIVTHLLWDRITHTDTYMYVQKAGLNLESGEDTQLRIWLQWISSVAGLVLLLWQTLALPKMVAKQRTLWWPYWPVVTLTIVVVVLLRSQFQMMGDDAINTFLGGVLGGILLASLLQKMIRSPQNYTQ